MLARRRWWQPAPSYRPPCRRQSWSRETRVDSCDASAPSHPRRRGTLSRPPCRFVYLMKAIGICLIVYGHIAHATTVGLTPPVYLKQFGVAFFLFTTGFTLARERRSVVEVLFRRLFPVYFFGLSVAVLIAVTGAIRGSGLALSNFLPFAAGANILFDNFPANPTTWYIGTYIHFVLLWAWPLRRIRVRGWMIAVAVAMEIPIRALLIAFAGQYVAYMLLVNWTAVFLLGMAKGAEDERDATDSPIPYAAARIRSDISIHDAESLAGDDRPGRRVRGHLAALRFDDPARVRGDSPRRGAGARQVRRTKFVDHFSGAHARLLRAAPHSRGLGAHILGQGRRAVGNLRGWPWRRVGSDPRRHQYRSAARPGVRDVDRQAPAAGGRRGARVVRKHPMSRVDVIVPCYNYGDLIEQCVRSVLSQEGVDVRVLIMDDASTDATQSVGRRLAADPRVEYRRHEVNRGHIATYNEALALLTGEYCVILSADDLLTSGSPSATTSRSGLRRRSARRARRAAVGTGSWAMASSSNARVAWAIPPFSHRRRSCARLFTVRLAATCRSLLTARTPRSGCAWLRIPTFASSMRIRRSGVCTRAI